MARRKKLEWTVAAESQLEGIRVEIAQNSPINARRFIARIRKAVKNLRVFPAMGQLLASDDDDELREIYVQSYRIIFRATENVVRVIAVIHGARNFRVPDQ